MAQTESVKSYTGTRLIPLSEMRDQRLKTALAVWEEKRQARIYPARAELTPRDMKAFLPNITLWRAVKGGTDYEYRIMGGADVKAYGLNMTGLHVSDLDRLMPGNTSRVKKVLDYVVRKKIPVVSDGWLTTSGGLPVHHVMIFFPLGPDEAMVDHILGVSVHGGA